MRCYAGFVAVCQLWCGSAADASALSGTLCNRAARVNQAACVKRGTCVKRAACVKRDKRDTCANRANRAMCVWGLAHRLSLLI